MKNYPFNFETLNEFSNSLPYEKFSKDTQDLFDSLNQLKNKYRFPAVENNVGGLLSFLVSITRPKIIFEMGSGYGHSAFWYLQAQCESIEKIVLTERRTDLMAEFNNLSWPADFREKIEYHQGDAFEKIKEVDAIDLILIDGQKSDYQSFIQKIESKLNTGALVVIDNSYWRGSFLDSSQRAMHGSAKAIHSLHEFIKENSEFQRVFIPFKDGVTVLRKK